MATISLEDVIASNPRFKGLDTNKVREYYEDVLRERNPTVLPEVVVKTKSVKAKAKEARAALEAKMQEAALAEMQDRLSIESLEDASKFYSDKFNRDLENKIIAANIDRYENMPARNAAYNTYFNDPQFIYHRNLESADAQVKRTAFSDDKTLNLVMNAMTPSQQVGAIRDGNGLSGYWESLRNGNSGFVTEEYARKHPHLSNLINLTGDIAAGGLLSKAITPRNIIGASDFIVNIPSNTRHLTKQIYRTPYKILGNKSLRSHLKPLTLPLAGKDRYGYEFFNRLLDRENILSTAQENRIAKQLNINPEQVASTQNRLSVDIYNPTGSIKNDFIKFENPITKSTYTRPIQLESYNARRNYSRNFNTEYKDVIVDANGTYRVADRNNPLSRPIQDYTRYISNRIGDDGIIGGSSVIYGKNYAVGVPNDLELITTKSRLQNLAQKLEAKNVSEHKGAGYRIDSDLSLKDSKGIKQPFDVQVIEETNGKASGVLAHEYYSYLYPDEYKKLVAKQVQNKLSEKPNWQLKDIELPISAEELYSKITPEVQEGKLLHDTFISDLNKHVDRAYQMLTHDDPSIRQIARQQMRKQVEKHFGKNYKFASEEYPNLTFDNVSANKKFLRQLHLPEKYATNSEIMKNIVDRWHIAETTQARNVSQYFRGEKYINDYDDLNKTLQTIYAPVNRTSAGIGGNTIRYYGSAGLSGDFTGIMKQRLTFHPEKINTPSDLINQNARLNNFRNRYIVTSIEQGTKEADIISGEVYKRFNSIEDNMRSEASKLKEQASQGLIDEDDYNSELNRIYQRGLEEHEKLAEEYDLPVYQGGEYQQNSIGNNKTRSYSGNLSRPEIGSIYPESGLHIGNRTIGQEVGGTGIPRLNSTTTQSGYIYDPIAPTIASRKAFSGFNSWSFTKEIPFKNPTKFDLKVAEVLRNEDSYAKGVNLDKHINKISQYNRQLLKGRRKYEDIKRYSLLGTTTAGIAGGTVYGVKKVANKNKSEINDSLTKLKNKIDVNNPSKWSKEDRDKYFEYVGEFPENYNIFKENTEDYYNLIEKYYKEKKINKNKNNKEK